MLESDFINIIKSIDMLATYSVKLNSISISMIVGSIGLIVGTTYKTPSIKVRKAYLFFYPGWLLLALSIIMGDKISRVNISKLLPGNKEKILDLLKTVNDCYLLQQIAFLLAIIIFLIWISFYLYSFIFEKENKS